MSNPYPYKGDTIYVIDTKLDQHGERGVITESTMGRVYNWDCDWDHTVRLDSGKVIVLEQDQVSWKEPRPRAERIAADKAARLADELASLDRQGAAIKARRKQLQS